MPASDWLPVVVRNESAKRVWAPDIRLEVAPYGRLEMSASDVATSKDLRDLAAMGQVRVERAVFKEGDWRACAWIPFTEWR